MRHGLVPNLLDSGNNPRYNARDAVWWFLQVWAHSANKSTYNAMQAIQDYCSSAPEGVDFLKEPVTRLFMDDKKEISRCSMAQLIQEIMQKHANGISFREVQ